jgi:hypothetical protein
MTTTLSATHRAIHFPGPLNIGPDGVLVAPPRERLVEIAEAVDPNLLLVFSSRLIKGARRRRFKASRAALNRAYLELARLCIDRTLTAKDGEAQP